MRRFITRKILLSVLSTALPVLAQQGAAVFSPVPPLNRDGTVPDMKDNFVFVDPPTGDIVLAYPDPQAPGQNKKLRFGRHNQVDPVVTSTVTALPGGGYKYAYTVQNGPKGKKKLQSWSISSGTGDNSLAAKHPLWTASSAPSAVGRPGTIRPEVMVTFNADSKTKLAQGVASGGFEIVSAYRPGVTVGYAQGEVDAEIPDSLVASLPQKAKDQLLPLLAPQWDSVQVLTIGPKYARDDPKTIVAMDFYRTLQQLSITGGLKADSAFVTGGLAVLESYLRSPGSASLTPRLDFLGKASAGLESEIAAAMRISLQ
jgi:hypothetical protein